MTESRQLPIKLAVADPNKRKEISHFCERVNMSLNNLSPTMVDKIISLSILLTCGEPKENLNPGICQTLVNYMKENIGPFQVTFRDSGDIDKVTLGNLDMGSLYCKPLDEEAEKKYMENHKLCHAILPSMNSADSMYLTLENKMIVGNQDRIRNNDRDNAYIGIYYFNRERIGKDLEQAELVRFEMEDANTVKQVIECYDKQGNKTQDVRMTHLQPAKHNSYHILYQEEIEDSSIVDKSHNRAI